MSRIGLISDTHGLLRPEALEVLAGSVQILHAGDIGSPELLHRLGQIAPVHVVRGNNDREAWAAEIPHALCLHWHSHRIGLIHDRAELDAVAALADCDIIVCGHSHRPCIERAGVRLIVNPGSAGPRRFRLPVSVAELNFVDGHLDARVIELVPGPSSAKAEKPVRATRRSRTREGGDPTD